MRNLGGDLDLYCPQCNPSARLGSPRRSEPDKWQAPCFRCGRFFELEKGEETFHVIRSTMKDETGYTHFLKFRR